MTDTPPYLQTGGRNDRTNELYPLISPAFECKMRLKWTDVRQSFLQADQNKNGLISKKEMWQLFLSQNLPVTEPEFERIFEYFDPNHTGMIDYQDFDKKMGNILHFRSEQDQLDHLAKNRAYLEKRSRNIALDQSVTWNNEFRQVLCSRQHVPLVNSVLQGQYFQNRSPHYVQMESGVPTVRRIGSTSQDWDNQRKQPLLQSLLSGCFHKPDLDKSKARRSVRKINHFIIQNIRAVSPKKQQQFQPKPPTIPRSKDELSIRFSDSTNRFQSLLIPTNLEQLQAIVSSKYNRMMSKEDGEYLLHVLQVAKRAEKEDILKLLSILDPEMLCHQLRQGNFKQQNGNGSLTERGQPHQLLPQISSNGWSTAR